MSDYTTKVTRMKNGYGCRVFYKGNLIVEGRVEDRSMIGPAFRDLLRTLDKMGGDAFTAAARKRKWREGNISIGIKHRWNWNI